MVNNLYLFTKCRTHFGMPRESKMSLALNELEYVTTSKHAPLVKINKDCMQNDQWNLIRNQLANKMSP